MKANPARIHENQVHLLTWFPWTCFTGRAWPPRRPRVVDTDSARVVFENDKLPLHPHHNATGKNACGLGLHSHPAHLYIQIQSENFACTTPRRQDGVVDGPAGDVGWEPAVTHRVESVSPAASTSTLSR